MKTWSAVQMQEHQKFPKSHTFDICVSGGSLLRGKVQEGPRGWQWYFSMYMVFQYSYSRFKTINPLKTVQVKSILLILLMMPLC